MKYHGFDGEIELADNRTVYIRKVKTGDGPGIQQFFESLSPQSWDFFQAHPTTDDVISRRVERAVNGDDWVYVALAENKVVAYFFMWNIDQSVPLLGIGITDAWQNCKMGQKLMNILIEDAKALGKDGVELTTRLNNDRAFHVYQKVGFQYYGDVENEIASGEIVIERGMFMPLKEGATRPETKHECPD